MHPSTTNKTAQTHDVYRFSFESSGALGFINEYSGLAVIAAQLYRFRRTQAACPYGVI